MRFKRTVWILPFLITGVVSVNTVHGGTSYPDAVVGLRGGFVLPTQDPARGAESEIGPAVAFDVLFTMANSLMLGIGVLGASTDVEHPVLGSATVKENVYLSTGLLLLEYHPRFEGISPYAVLGVGATRIDFGSTTVGCTSNPIVFAICAGTIDQDEVEGEMVLAAKVGGGVDYFLNDHLALNSEVAWIYNAPAENKLQAGGGTAGRDDLDFSRLTVFVGLRYYFNYDD